MPGATLPLQVGAGGGDGREVRGLRDLPRGVRDDEVGLLAERGPSGGIVGSTAAQFASNRSRAPATGWVRRTRSGGSARTWWPDSRRTAGPGTMTTARRRGRRRRSRPAGARPTRRRSPTGGRRPAPRCTGRSPRETRPCRPCRRVAGCRTPRPVPGAFEADPDRASRRPRERRRVRAGVSGQVHIQPHGSRHDVFADPHPQPDVHTVLAGQRQQQLGVHGLQIPGIAAGSGTAQAGGVGWFAPRCPPAAARRPACPAPPAPIASTWMEWARWSAKYTTIARLANSSTIAPLTASRGNSSVRAPADSPTVYRPAAE